MHDISTFELCKNFAYSELVSEQTLEGRPTVLSNVRAHMNAVTEDPCKDPCPQDLHKRGRHSCREVAWDPCQAHATLMPTSCPFTLNHGAI